MTRPCGWVPDPPGRVDILETERFEKSIGAVTLADTGSIPRPMWTELDQRGESCTGHYAVQAIYGCDGTKTSPYFAWWFGRAHDLGVMQDMPNIGVSSWAMRQALANHGVCPWEMWRPGVDGFALHDRPPAVARLAAQKRNLRLATLTGLGDGIVEGVCTAIARGQPVGIVVEVDEGFEASRGDSLIGPVSGGVRGLHIVTGWEYRTVAGERQVRVVNSWLGWGDRNTAWLSAERVKQAPYLCAAVGVS